MSIQSTRIFGIFFILSFASYATGVGLMETLQNSSLQPIQVIKSKESLVIGAILIAIFHTVFNLGLLNVMFNVFKKVSLRLSITYLLLGAFGTFLLAVGAVFLLLPISISETIIQSKQVETSDFSLILNLSSRGNFYCYQIGMIIWGMGGFLFCYLLNKAKLLPALFPISGYIGYSIFIVGCILELLGKPYGVMLSIPGGLFEILLSIWLIAKGFNKIDVTIKVN